MVSSLREVEPTRIAIVDDRRTSTFGELNERANRVLSGLRSLGLEPGQRIATLAGNQVEFFEVAVATGHGGIGHVPLNWHWTAPEVAYVLDDADVRSLIVDRAHLDVAVVAVDAARIRPDSVFVVGDDPGPFRPYEELLDTGTPGEPDHEATGRPMFYTSGTTGRPKGVVTAGAAVDTPPSWAATGRALAAGLRMPVDGVQLLCGPVYHAAQWAWTVPLVHAGNTVVARQRFDAAEVLRLIDEWQVTGVHLVPTQFVRLLRLDEATRSAFDGGSLAAVWHGAAPCPPEVKRRMIDWWGPVIWEYYGGSEGGILSTVSSEDWCAHPGTVGWIAAGYEVVVTDEDGAEVATGTPGQIWFRRSTGERFEYHNAPEKTAASRRGDYATLGDVGYFDDDGYLYLSDRAIDMIISGGVNIYPAEVEHCLLEHPAVVDVAVIGIPDEEYGERVMGVVEAADDAAAGDLAALADDLERFARARIAGYKVPRSFEFVDSLPRLASGKLRKRELRERYSDPG